MGEEQNSWEDMLRALLGDEAADRAISAMRDAGLDPDAMGGAVGLPTDAAGMGSLVNQIRNMMSSSGDGPVNWNLARDVARQQVHSGGDPMPSAAQAARLAQYLQIADLWLDEVTELVAPPPTREVYSRAQWVEATLPAFQELAEPVAANVVRAITDVLRSQADQIAGLGMLGGGAEEIMKKIGGATFGMQLGSAVATLAGEAFGLTDIGLHLGTPGTQALVPATVDAFADGLELPHEEIAQFLAVREAASARLYAATPWLRSHVVSLVRSYASEIRIDLEAMEEAIRSVDPSNPENLKEAMSSGIFALEVSEIQRAALENLETTLAVIEGWVEDVTTQATFGRLDGSTALTEMMRRRRAAGGPAEATFRTLVGLEMRPRRCRDAAALWAHLREDLGVAGRDALWAHPDLMPTAAELDDPTAVAAARGAVSSFDDELAAFLEDLQRDGGAGGAGGGGSSAPDGREDPPDDGAGGGEAGGGEDTSR